MALQPPRPPDDDAPVAGWVGFQLPAPSADDPTGYLRAHAGQYTREALTARLAAAGHPADAIAAAWATIDAEDAAEGRRDRRGTVSKVIGAAYILTWLAVTVAWLAPNAGQPGTVAFLSGMLAVALFIPGILGYALARRSRRLRRAGTGTAVAFAIVPLLVLAALAGTCLAAIPPSGFG